MAQYFPLFCSLEGQPVLVIGSNKKAHDKAELLSPFGADIIFVNTRIPDAEALLTGTAPKLVIVADETLVDLQKLFDTCVKMRIEINTVDNRACSTFIFPSMICKERLTVAVSTGGASPAAAVKLRREIEKILPDGIDGILGWLASLRPVLRAREDIDKKALPAIYRALADASFSVNRPLDTSETECILQQFTEN